MQRNMRQPNVKVMFLDKIERILVDVVGETSQFSNDIFINV